MRSTQILLGQETGSAIVLVAVLMSIMTFGLIGYQVMSTSYQRTMQHLNTTGQADSISKSGLIDTLTWFRRQSTQPVANMSDPNAAFAPRESTNDTIDEDVGLVKEYAISNNSMLWARYEVRRGTTLPNGQLMGVHDITHLRMQDRTAGEGFIWSVESFGYVYQRLNPVVAFNVAPNKVLATCRINTEFRRLGLTLPAEAAILVLNRSTVNLENHSQLQGGSVYGLAYYIGGTAPAVDSGSEIAGQPSDTIQLTGTPQGLSSDAIFSAPMDQIRFIADSLVTSSQTLPSTYRSNEIVFVDGNATFDSNHLLNGSGLLIVNGNLTITSGANTFFSGLIYVTGNVQVLGPAAISGALVTQGSFATDGLSDTVTIRYDPTVLNTLRQQLGMYHLSHNLRYVFSGGVSR